jgi:hypothetical protein
MVFILHRICHLTFSVLQDYVQNLSPYTLSELQDYVQNLSPYTLSELQDYVQNLSPYTLSELQDYVQNLSPTLVFPHLIKFVKIKKTNHQNIFTCGIIVCRICHLTLLPSCNIMCRICHPHSYSIDIKIAN